MARHTAGALVVMLALICAGEGNLAGSAAHHTKRHRSGCGSFCQQAGGLGGDPGIAPVDIVLPRPFAEHAGVVALTLRCRGRRRCDGAVVIFPHSFSPGNVVDDGVPRGSYDGVDLALRPGAAVTLEIPLSRTALALLRRRHRLVVDLLVELDTTPVSATSRNKVNLLAG